MNNGIHQDDKANANYGQIETAPRNSSCPMDDEPSIYLPSDICLTDIDIQNLDNIFAQMAEDEDLFYKSLLDEAYADAILSSGEYQDEKLLYG